MPAPHDATLLLAALVVTALTACSDGPQPLDPASREAATASRAGGVIVKHVPSEDPGAPYYADIQRGYVVTDGGWAAIVLFRSPECIRPDFNLLDWFDPPTAFGCATTYAGDTFWDPPPAAYPFKEDYSGLGATPVYFVDLSELRAAMADDVLTIGELQGLPSLLVGRAALLDIVVHNQGASSQGTNHGHSRLIARGELEDGRSFELRYNEKFLPETRTYVFQAVKISFE